MKSPGMVRMAWVGLAVGALGLLTSYLVNPPEARAQCRSVPCAYVEGGERSLGTCGSKDTDPAHCYCFRRDERAPALARVDQKWPSILQPACER